ncbi:MAG: DUF4080 domain-containing protein [Chthoniobacteraceae bacterium]|nr:DUF4080 domain-containing protein [Chthoniobacteraceae bacterium]
MQPLLLSTLNAKYLHASFGLRCLAANMGDLAPRTRIAEFDINQRPLEIVEALLAPNPALIGLGVYVWNARETLETARLLKRVAPAVPLVVGGPEVSHEPEAQEICALADVVICGEADLAFAEVCRDLLAGTPTPHLIRAEPPDLAALASPYALYAPEDLAHRVLYVEASRGCPFGCEFCLSSLAPAVRQFPLERFLEDMERLLARGARQFKFVDRTFNLHLPTSLAILDFFRRRCQPGLFLHFEIVPDRLPQPLREALAAFPPGTLQLEAGVQTFNPEVAARIHRRQDYALLEENLRFLRAHTHAHLHADLIAGLPGESLESFGAGFDRLLSLRPHEIQVGILKRLRGAPIARHTDAWEMVYAPGAPYELLRNRDLGFPAMQRLRRFAKYWDALANSGNYRETVTRLWGPAQSPFHAFLAFADWAFQRLRRTDSIGLNTWAETLFAYLTGPCGQEPAAVRAALESDFARAGRRERPAFLRQDHRAPSPASASPAPPKRQQRHLQAES